MKTLLLKLFIFILFTQNTYAQCFEIESILVDACGTQEGLNEMVRFKVGAAPLNTSALNVNWPNNSWQGLTQNATTASKVAALNADIINAGGCGELIEPIGGVLPANATVILVTSFNLDITQNSFGALTEDIYIIFQNNATTTTGHFANFGTGLRTLTMTFGACFDVATYNRALLVSPTGQNVASDGATVLFDPAGNATYVNYGCSAPVQPFLVDINNPSSTVCPGDVISLTGTAEGHQSVLWIAPSGVFSNPGGLTTSYTVPANATGTITLTLTATNNCGLEINDTVLLTIAASVVPDFTTSLTLCSGDTPTTLNTTSPNGITGTWSPSAINNTTGGNYVFTPGPNQCATSVTLVVAITNVTLPDFATSLTLCSGDTAPALNTTSPNGITGTWSPSTINNTIGGNYLFTPDTGQCASPVTLTVSVSSVVTPDFATSLTLCSGDTPPALNTTSPNGITGTWSPSAINTTTGGNYVFTPGSNQCATSVVLSVTINAVTVTLSGANTICVGQSTLFTPSLNGGTWFSNDPAIAIVDSNGNVTAIGSGTATIRYLIQGTCSTTVSKTITVVNLPAPSLTDRAVCIDNLTGEIIAPVLLESGLPATDYTFVWTLDGDILSTTQNNHLATETGIYNVTATHNTTGCSGSSTSTVTASSIASGEAFVGQDFHQNQVITVSVTGGSGNYEYILNNGPVQTQPYFTNVLQGENVIVVRDINGCGDLVLTVYSLNYPRFFTPNGDGYNDTWNISGLEDQPKSIIYIFDRYGKLLKTLKASGGNGWDGTYNGENMPSTDYWFKLLYTNRDGFESEFKAHFSLKR